MKKIITGILCTVVIIFALIAIVGVLSSDSTTENENQYAESSVISQKSENDKLIHEDDFIKVWYINSFEQPEITTNTCYFTLKVENKTDKQITFLPMDASADDFMINIFSGLPLNIKPGKIGQNTFFFSYDGLAENIEDISLIEFEVNLLDENSSSIHKANISFNF